MNYTFAERSVSLYEWCGGYDYPYYENENGGQMDIPPLKDKEEIREFVDGWRRTAQRCVEENVITDFTICIFYIEYYTGKNYGNISEDDYLEVTKLQNLYGYIWRVQNELGVYDTEKRSKKTALLA